jgi:hypothetical protein
MNVVLQGKDRSAGRRCVDGDPVQPCATSGFGAVDCVYEAAALVGVQGGVCETRDRLVGPESGCATARAVQAQEDLVLRASEIHCQVPGFAPAAAVPLLEFGSVTGETLGTVSAGGR